MKKTKKRSRKSRDPRRKLRKKTSVRRRRSGRRLSGSKVKSKSKYTGGHADIIVMGKCGSRKKSRKGKKRSKVFTLGNPCSQVVQPSLIGTRGYTMPKKSMPWFKKSRRRKGRRSLLGADRAGRVNVMSMVRDGALTVGGAAIGSMVAARVPLPVKLVGFRGFLPIVAGIALGSSKFGRRGMGQQIALGMVVAGGLAIGRQYAPQLFAGEDEMLGLPALDQGEMMGLEYQSGEGDEENGDVAGLEYQSGEDPEEVELFGEFATSADL